MATLFSGSPQELAMMRVMAAERRRLAGCTIQYYRLDVAENWDPLYRDNSVEVFGDPVELVGTVEFVEADNKTSTYEPGGKKTRREAKMYLAHNECVDAGLDPRPQLHDVVLALGLAWDVKSGDKETQWLHSVQQTATEYEYELVSRDEFNPQRRLDGE